ncbi:MAG: hypothetical protein ACODTU_20470 [Pigmentiphaga sp.]|uniref:hypothetical protein n=1 Tax=Pigmentiphaga sp. TaxID=1977564 RepID=UPI003B560FCA
MNLTHTQATPEEVANVRLTLDVSYILNDEDLDDVLIRLERRCELAIGDGMLTGELNAEVDTWSINVSAPPSKAESAALEAEIATFMQQRIEDGNLGAEDISVRLARYGLMAPEAFADEMHERMGMDDDAPRGQAVILSTEPTDGKEIEMQVAVACANAFGIPDMPVFKARVTQEEYDLGVHYEKAKSLAGKAGYEGPFVCYDVAEYGAILSAARKLGLVPQVVVIDMTDGQIHSIRCDSGEIKVIYYDTSDTDEYSAAVTNQPLGENGQLVRCWSHTQLAQVDSGLKLARD